MRSHKVLGCLLLLLAPLFGATLPAAEEVITNKDVIEMIKAGLGTDLISTKVTSSDTAFDMSSKAMIELKQSNVPDPVINLMLQEYMKTQKKLRSRIALEVQNLASENTDLRRKAYAYLRAIDSAALPQVEEALGSNVPALRAAAATALGDLGDKNAVMPLRALLTDGDQAVRFAAAYSLNLLRDEEALALARRSISSGTAPLDGFLKLAGLRKDHEYVGFISVRLLKDTDAQTRAQAAWALGEIANERGLSALEDALLNDREIPVKKEAALALGKIKADSSFEKLTDCCRRYPAARKELLTAIGNYPVNRSASFLVAALGQPLTPDQKTEVLNSLRRLTGRDYGDDLLAWRTWLSDNKISGNSAALNPPAPAGAPVPPAAAPAGQPAPAAPDAGSAAPAAKDAAQPLAPGAPLAPAAAGTTPDPLAPGTPLPASPGAAPAKPATAPALPADLPDPVPAKSGANSKKTEEEPVLPDLK